MAAALLIYEFQSKEFGWLRYVAYTFSTYALILLCTGYARRVKRDRRRAAAFTLPLIPTLLFIAVGTALLIYVFAAGNYGPLAYVAYLLSAYALILGVTSYVRMAHVMGQASPSTDEPLYLQIKAVLAALILPLLNSIGICVTYVFVKTFKGVRRGSVLTILSGLCPWCLFWPFTFSALCFSWWVSCAFTSGAERSEASCSAPSDLF